MQTKKRKYRRTEIILMMIALIALSYQVITYTIRETVVYPGVTNLTADTTRTLSRQPVVGGIALVSVIAFLVRGNKRS